MKKNIRTRIIAKLRDPIWQAIGALIALIALVTSFFIWQPSVSQAAVRSESTYDLFTNLSGIDGCSYACKQAYAGVN